MVTRKRNEWLDADESEEGEQDSELEDESRARMVRSSKRRKQSHQFESEEDSDEGDKDGEEASDIDEQGQEEHAEAVDEDEDHSAELARLEKLAASLPTDLHLASGKLTKPLPPLSKPKKDKSGVIYLSRVPPFMKPQVLRSLLTPYGAVGRIFLTPESSTQRTQRLKSGGTRRKLFLDGWVEFESKKDAKFVAEHLNAQTMGGKKRGRWHDEVWNIRYLSGVKWALLVERIQNENAERAARLRHEIAKSKRENAQFLENIEKGKMISGIQAKRKQKKGVDGGREDEAVDAVREKQGRRSKFQQHEIKTKMEKKLEPGQDIEKVLGGIF